MVTDTKSNSRHGLAAKMYDERKSAPKKRGRPVNELLARLYPDDAVYEEGATLTYPLSLTDR